MATKKTDERDARRAREEARAVEEGPTSGEGVGPTGPAAPDQADSLEARHIAMPYPGDGTNTGQTNPQAGPAPEVTLPVREVEPDAPADAGLRDVEDPAVARARDEQA